MINSFTPGDIVKVWPRPGLLVQAHPQIHGRFLAPEGEQLIWSEWLHSRVMDGSMLLTDPREFPSLPKAASKGDK